MRRIALPLLFLLVLSASVVLVFGQANVPAEEQSILNITVAHSTCSLILNGSAAVTPDPEATSEAISAAQNVAATLKSPLYPLLTLGSDCANVLANLHIPNNDTLWVKFSIIEAEDPWQQFKIVPGDSYPPKFDKRGRFVGCSIPEMGDQTCRVLWANQGTTYLIEIPLTVGSAYIAPVVPTNPPAPAVSTAAPIPVSTPNSGVWGSCGSCTTCGGPVEQCVQAPDNTCVWDAQRCEHRKPGDN